MDTPDNSSNQIDINNNTNDSNTDNKTLENQTDSELLTDERGDATNIEKEVLVETNKNETKNKEFEVDKESSIVENNTKTNPTKTLSETSEDDVIEVHSSSEDDPFESPEETMEEKRRQSRNDNVDNSDSCFNSGTSGQYEEGDNSIDCLLDDEVNDQETTNLEQDSTSDYLSAFNKPNNNLQDEITSSNYVTGALSESKKSTTDISKKVIYKMRNKMNFDEMLEACSKCKYLPETDMRRLCDYVMDILQEEPNVQSIQSPVTICGDIHGQFYDMLELFRVAGHPPQTNYIFLGDFVDRGHYSLETLTYLLILKARYPGRITLLRGNHETRQITQVYGFYEECLLKYGNVSIWQKCVKVFDLLSISAIVDNSIFCVHGGLSPSITTIDQIQTIFRNQELPHAGSFCDLLWSDPVDDDSKGWQMSPRGAGYLFNKPQVDEFLHVNDLSFVARAHQLMFDGIKWLYDEKLVTIWSAPNYCYRCGNRATVLEVNSDGTHSARSFTEVPWNMRERPDKKNLPYFL